MEKISSMNQDKKISKPKDSWKRFKYRFKKPNLKLVSSIVDSLTYSTNNGLNFI